MPHAELQMCSSQWPIGCPVEVFSEHFGWRTAQVMEQEGQDRICVEFMSPQGYCCRKRVAPQTLRHLDDLELQPDETDPELFFDDCLKMVRGTQEPPAPRLVNCTCVRCGNTKATKEEGATNYKCPKCGRRCEKCKALYIPGKHYDCGMAKAWAEMKNGHFRQYWNARARVAKELKDENSEVFSICPACLQGIMKEDDDQCDHMTCFNCGHEFCFECHADRTAIKAHGNHHHEQTCRYHFVYFGRDKFMPDECRQCRKENSLCIRPGGQRLWDELGEKVAKGELDERRIYKENGHKVEW
ncbi:unnamed protein product [Effrenium voratum]|uniref:IBR domain-containing protein n=1 Tax=Effrenium voratum TaxID=2562239 RepID=A0AA36NMM1_9DINO|nr:unnamed protein product [Effrenium voratum]